MEPPSPSLSQATFAAAMVATAVGSYLALSPPNPSAEPTAAPKENQEKLPDSDHPHTKASPKDGHPDTIRSLALTHPIVAKACLAPLGILSLHTAALALSFPFRIPGRLLGHAAVSPAGINPDMISWSAATALPMAVILCAGLPLRLGPYSALGRNFTFALARPDRLTTTGIYKYVQHPSYVGLVLTLMGNAALLWRQDGVLSCWLSPAWMETLVRWKMVEVFLDTGLVMGLWMLWKRTLEEEEMLKKAFGAEWEEWHAKTARFIPGIF
jgi:protein-S-isoprenylcysteine O-methyltransferase Ste14